MSPLESPGWTSSEARRGEDVGGRKGRGLEWWRRKKNMGNYLKHQITQTQSIDGFDGCAM